MNVKIIKPILLSILTISYISVASCTSSYSVEKKASQETASSVVSEDSTYVSEDASKYFPKAWDGGEMEDGRMYTVPDLSLIHI